MKLWNTLMKCDARGRAYLKDEEAARREKEKVCRKKEKRNTKKKATKEKRRPRGDPIRPSMGMADGVTEATTQGLQACRHL